MQRRTLLVLPLLGAATTASAQPLPPIRQIRFAPGTSGATVGDSVIRGDRDIYALDVARGQEMTVRITSLEDNAVFQIYLPGARPRITPDGFLETLGQTLPGAGEGQDAMQWAGILPAAGRYLIIVGGTRGNATYRLTVGVK